MPSDDEQGFEEFVLARRGALLRTGASSATGTHADAEDLVQATLLKVVPRWKRIADLPEPYVRQVLARESISRWRSRRWREKHVGTVPERAVALGTAPTSGWCCALPCCRCHHGSARSSSCATTTT